MTLLITRRANAVLVTRLYGPFLSRRPSSRHAQRFRDSRHLLATSSGVRQLPGAPSGSVPGTRPSSAGAVVTAAQHLVADLLAGRASSVSATTTVAPSRTRSSVDDPPVEPPGPAAPAEHLHLQRRDLVGELEQPRGAGEQPSAEVGGDAEGVDVDLDVVGQHAPAGRSARRRRTGPRPRSGSRRGGRRAQAARTSSLEVLSSVTSMAGFC